MIKTTQAELAARDEWIQKYLIAGDILPFRFRYGGRSAHKLLPAWKREFSQSIEIGGVADPHGGATAPCGATAPHNGVIRYTATWTDPATGLEVTCKAASYPDYPTIEWTLYIKNNGTANTPILQDIKGMDIVVPRNAEDDCVIRTLRGDICSVLNYEPLAYDLKEYGTLKFAPFIGKPCVGAFPYFNVQTADRGVIAAVGWPGQWEAYFRSPYWFPAVGPTKLYISAGQELTCLSLRPGEEIRAQLSLLMFWEGDYTRSQNLWRRFVNDHNTPRRDGRIAPPLTTDICGNYQIEDEQFKKIQEYADSGVKLGYWGVDAGWFPCPGESWWNGSGTWTPDEARFPDGLKPLADAAHVNGMKFSLWFEPERVYEGSWIHMNHPEWLYAAENNDSALEGSHLLNLGCPEAVDWLIEHFSRLFAETGVDIYRQDFCFPPLHCWREADAPDRQGMAENLHVQGYLRFWDELLRRNPGLMIDSCAGGGGRQELETLRRTSLIMSRTDYCDVTMLPESQQNMTYGLSMWHTRFMGDGPFEDRYAFLSGMAADMSFLFVKKPFDRDLAQDSMRMFHEAAGDFFGDYYPLTAYSRENSAWMAYQFDRPEAGGGIVQAFRRGKAAESEMVFRLNGLDAGAEYEVADVQTRQTLGVMLGAELMDAGLRVELPSPRSAALIKYKRMTS